MPAQSTWLRSERRERRQREIETGVKGDKRRSDTTANEMVFLLSGNKYTYLHLEHTMYGACSFNFHFVRFYFVLFSLSPSSDSLCFSRLHRASLNAIKYSNGEPGKEKDSRREETSDYTCSRYSCTLFPPCLSRCLFIQLRTFL